VDATKPTGEQAPRPSPPPPLEADDQLVIRVITAGWAVALVVLLIVRGVAFGLFGLWYVPRLKRGRARAADKRGMDQSAPRDSGSNTVSPTEIPGSSTRS
jgi:hypothetical protein